MSRKIRVCHITSAHPSYDMRIFQKECCSLAQKDNFKVYLVAPGEGRKENNVTVIVIGDNFKGRIHRIVNISRKVYKVAKSLKADVYHIHDPELLLYARKLKTSSNIVIFDSHENYPKQITEKKYLPFFLRHFTAFLYKNYETYVVKKIDATIIPGLTMGKNPFKGRSKRTVIIDNYPILDDRRQYIKRKKKEDLFTVCYTGGLSKERGISKLIEACYIAGAKLILAGKFSTEEYKNEVLNMEQSVCVDYRGYCNYDEVTEIYKESDVGAATLLKIGQYSVMSNLPTKTYEYMQVGLPIIMTDTDYNIQLIQKENFAYLVNPDDVIEMAELIKSISENYDCAVKKTELAYQLVQKKYNWNTESEKLILLYKKLIKNVLGENI